MENEFNLSEKALGANQKVAGYTVNNLTDGNIFITKKISNISNLSFKLYDIEMKNGSEIMKIVFKNGAVIRVIKFMDEAERASAVFDIVDEINKIIVMKSQKTYVGGIGIADMLYGLNFITQWEIPILTILCRGFVLGDRESIRNLIKLYSLKIEMNNEYRLKEYLGIALL